MVLNYKDLILKNIFGAAVITSLFGVFSLFQSDIQNIALTETIPFYNPEFEQTEYTEPAFEANSEAFLTENKSEQPITEEENKEIVPALTMTQQPKDIKLTDEEITALKDFNYLKKTLYTIDKDTDLLPTDINVDEFVARDLTIDNTIDGPKILIVHTHSTEGFSDSDMTKDMNEGIWGVGEKLKNVLQDTYGIETMHDVGRYDIVNGKGQISGAYERMEPAVLKILEQNPSIQFVIDLHRDGWNENTRIVREFNGKKYAPIMFFNGMCRIYKQGVLTDMENLKNPYLTDNLALSFNLQIAANKLYPGFARKIYLKSYRYSLNMLPKSILVELGGNTNTKEEALNAVDPLAEIIASVILK